jgi:hypothetical protein
MVLEITLILTFSRREKGPETERRARGSAFNHFASVAAATEAAWI